MSDRVFGWGIRPHAASIDYGGDETDADNGLPAAKRTPALAAQVQV
jgi:hypothetical protein